MADNINPTGDSVPSMSSSDKLQYEKEFKQGVSLFQRALNEYSKADEMNKKEAFKEVMQRALQVLQETSHELKRKDLEKETDQIAKDFEAYQENNSLKSVLDKDLKTAKRMIND